MDKRKRTSKINGRLGGRPKQLTSFKSRKGEVLKTIPGFPGYFASSLGRIVSTRQLKPKVLKTYKDKGGYVRVRLRANKHIRDMSVHRLVLMAFHGKCPRSMEGSHLNGVRDDNRVTNLAWENAKDNHARRTKHGTSQIGQRNPKARLTNKEVIELRKIYKTQDDMTMIMLSQKYGVSETAICNAIRRKSWKHI